MSARIEKRPPWLFWAIVLIAVASGAFACGSGSHGEESSAAMTATSGGKSSPADPQVAGKARSAVTKEGIPHCSSGSVRLSPDAPGAIDFRVRCAPPSRESTIRFALGRAPLSGQGKPGIRAFRHYPPIIGGDKTRRFGLCRTSFGGLACSARTKESVLVLGRIWVNPKTRCDFEVVISSAVERRCNGECPANSIAVILASGKPKGC